MAKENRDQFSATPGARAKGVKAVEEPLRVGGPRDALIEDGHNDQDYVPDVESKGYHVGMVRQPAKVAVNEAGQAVGFISEHESKFAQQPNITDLKAYHNEVESSDEWNEDVSEATRVTISDDDLKAMKAAQVRGATTKRAAASKDDGE